MGFIVGVKYAGEKSFGYVNGTRGWTDSYAHAKHWTVFDDALSEACDQSKRSGVIAQVTETLQQATFVDGHPTDPDADVITGMAYSDKEQPIRHRADKRDVATVVKQWDIEQAKMRTRDERLRREALTGPLDTSNRIPDRRGTGSIVVLDERPLFASPHDSDKGGCFIAPASSPFSAPARGA